MDRIMDRVYVTFIPTNTLLDRLGEEESCKIMLRQLAEHLGIRERDAAKFLAERYGWIVSEHG